MAMVLGWKPSERNGLAGSTPALSANFLQLKGSIMKKAALLLAGLALVGLLIAVPLMKSHYSNMVQEAGEKGEALGRQDVLSSAKKWYCIHAESEGEQILFCSDDVSAGEMCEVAKINAQGTPGLTVHGCPHALVIVE